MNRFFTQTVMPRTLLLSVAVVFGIITCVQISQAQEQGHRSAEPGIRHLYVPVEKLDAVWKSDRAGAVLTRREFDELVAAARGQAPESSASGTSILTANYSATIDGERLVANAVLELQSFDPGWAMTGFSVGGWNIEKASLNGSPARISRRNEDTNLVDVLLETEGLHQLELTLSTPLRAVGADKDAQFELPAASAGLFRISVPEGKHVTINGLKPMEDPQAAGTFQLAIGGIKGVQLRISDHRQQSRGDLLTFASTAFGVKVSPGEVTWISRTELQVVGKPLDQIVCLVPRTLEITGVESQGLEAWELSEPDEFPDRTMITLRYRVAFDGARNMTLTGIVRTEPGKPWRVPNLVLENVSSHVGRIVVEHPHSVRLQTVSSNGAQATSDIAFSTDGSLASMGFHVWQEDYDLQFQTQSKEREVQAAMTNILDIHSRGLELHVTVDFQTRFAPLFEAQFRIPAAWEVTGVSLGDQPIPWEVLPQEAGINEIRVKFDPPLIPGQNRVVAFTTLLQPEQWPVEETSQRVALPEVRLPQAGIIEALLGVVADEDLDLIPHDIIGLDPARQSDIELLNQRLASLGKQIRLGFAYQDTVFSGELEVARKPVSMTSETITFLNPGRENYTTSWEANLNVAGGGTRVLQVSASESAGTDLRFQIIPRFQQIQHQQQQAGQAIWLRNFPRIVEQQSADPENGRRLWTLRLDRYVRGEYILSCVAQSPRVPNQSILPHQFVVQGTDRSSGYVAVESSSDQYVEVQASESDGTPLREVDPVDFPPSLYRPQERVVAGYHFVRPGWQLAVTDQLFARSSVPTAFAHKAELTSVLSRSGEFQHKANLVFTAVGVQALMLQLPAGAELWSTTLDGSPVEVRHFESILPAEGNAEGIKVTKFQIPLTNASADQKRTLELLYSTQIAAVSGESPLGEQKLVAIPPLIQVRTGAGSDEPLDVLEHEWTLHHPAQSMITSSQGMFEPILPLGAETFFGEIQRSLRVPAAADLGSSALAIAIATAILFLFAWASRLRRSGGWRLPIMEVLVVLLIIVVLVALMLPAVQQSRVPAHRYFLTDDIAPTSEAAPAGADDFAATLAEPSTPLATTAPVPARSEEEKLSLEAINDPAEADRMFRKELGDMAQQVERPQAQREREMRSRRRMLDANGVMDADPFGVMLPSARPEDAPLPPSPAGGMGGVAGGVDESFIAQNNIPAFTSPQKPAAPAEQASTPVPAVVGAKAAGALLSLTLNLNIPDDRLTTKFKYRGDSRETGGVPVLDIDMMDRESGLMLLWAIAGGVLLVGWWLRKASARIRGLWFALTIGVPVAVVMLAPLQSHLVFEGVLAGGVGTMLLWALAGCVHCCCPANSEKTMSAKTAKAAGLLLVLGGTLTFAASSQAEELPPQVLPAAGEAAVIIPYEAGQDPLVADRVIVPPELFKKLWLAAHPEEIKPGVAPVPAIPAEAIYSATLVRDEAQEGSTPRYRVHVTGRYVIQLLVDGPRPVHLPVRDVSLETITIDGQPATIGVTESGSLTVIAQGRGVHIVDMTFDLPADVVTTRADGTAMEEGASAGQFRINLLPVLSGTFSISLPRGPDLQYRVNGSTGTYRLRQAEMQRSLEIPIDRGGQVQVSWQPKAQVGGTMETIQVDTGTTVVLDDTGLTVNNGYLIRVRQGGLNDFSFSLPADVSLKKISGADLAGWEQTENAEGARTLRVFLRRTVDDETRLQVSLFKALGINDTQQNLQIPLPEPLNVTREIGSVGVYFPEKFQVRLGDTTGLSQIAAGTFSAPEMPEVPQMALGYALRYTSRPISLTLQASRRLPTTRATVEHALRVGRRKQIVATLAMVNIAGAPRKSVSFTLPEGYLPIDVAGAAMVDWYVTAGNAGERLLTVEFDQPRSGDVTVSLEGHLQKQPDDPSVSINVPNPVGVSPLWNSVGIWVEESYTAVEAEVVGWKGMDPSELSGNIKQILPTQQPRFAYRSTEASPGTITLTTTRSVPQLSAEVVTLVVASEVSVDYGMTFRWKITQAAADTFTVITPDWLAGRMEFSAPGVRQVTSSALPDGRIEWKIELIDPMKGEYLATAVATIPAPVDRRVPTPELAFTSSGDDGAVPLEIQRQFAILVNLSPAQIVQDNPDQIEAISRSDLPLVVQEELLRQAVEIARVRPGKVPVWRALPLESKIGSQAMVVTASLQTVLETDGSWRTRASYAVRNRGRQFLPVRIPPNSNILSVIVRGEPSRTVTTQIGEETIHLVPLPQTSITDLSFEVEMIVTGRLPRSLGNLFSVTSQQVELPALTILSPKDSEQFGMPVAQTSWSVHVPDGIDAAPVTNVKNTNLTWNDGGASWVSSQMLEIERLRADFGEMVRLAKDKSLSSSQRTMSRSNLKQIGIALQELEQQAATWESRGEGTADTTSYSAIIRDNRDLQSEVERSLSEFDVEESKQRFDMASERVSSGKDLVISNNEFNVMSNTGQGIQLGDSDVNLNFRRIQGNLEPLQEKAVDKKGLEGKADQSRGKLKSQLGMQAPILSNSISGAYGELPVQAVEGGEQAEQLRAGATFGGRVSGFITQGRFAGQQAGQGQGAQNGEMLHDFSAPGIDGIAVERQLNRWQLQQFHDQGQSRADFFSRAGEGVQVYDTESDFDDSVFLGMALGRGTAGWTSTGGLSLPIEMPVAGHSLNFSKVGGDPVLTLAVRPKLQWTWLLGAVWGIGWLAVVVLSCVRLFQDPTVNELVRLLANMLIAVGLAGFVLLPGDVRWILFGAFLVGGLMRIYALAPAVHKTAGT